MQKLISSSMNVQVDQMEVRKWGSTLAEHQNLADEGAVLCDSRCFRYNLWRFTLGPVVTKKSSLIKNA